MTTKNWFITGTSRGFGREWAEAALKRGDRVAATARNVESLADLVDTYGDALLPIELDVTDRAGDFAAVARAHEVFGSLDVVINNAGYGHFGMIEEITEEELRAQLETNVFGAFWVTQAALPFMREQGSGHIIQVSSIGGITAFPMIGAYHASKWALEAFTQSLAAEVAGFGIKVTTIEPGGFSTDWAGDSAKHSPENPAYAEFREQVSKMRAGQAASRGNPATTGDVVLQLVDAAEPPLRVFFGTAPLGIAKAEYAKRIETWEQWNYLSVEAQG
jgi:NAD(P)-dependent dehydrogenase (short-subunit alcohol dehydrogenase family)